MLFDYFKNIEFGQPYFFVLFAAIPLLILWYYRSLNSFSASIKVSSTAAPGLKTWKSAARHLPFILRLLTLSALIFTLAKPQTRNVEQRTEGEGIDVILCIDVSGSMTAQELKPNRLEAAKSVAIDFVNRRPTDRIGVVIFAGESFTQCPLTTDYAVVIAAIRNIRNGLLLDGTAIGSGLSTSVDRIRNSKSKSKVIILLTDGENNGGLIDPQTAKEIAKAFAIKVYTIGVGTIGEAPMPFRNPDGSISTIMQKVAIDEPLMKQIATETGGKYFRATDNNSLSEIYTSIDQLEKSKVEVIKNVKFENKFLPFVAAAIFFLMLDLLFRYWILRKFP